MVVVLTLSKFQEGYEKGLIFDVFSITINSEKRIYGKTREGNALNRSPYSVVYAVVP